MTRRPVQTPQVVPATPGSLDPQVAADIRILDEFLHDRDQAIGRMIGRRVKPSPVRDALVRRIVLNFAEGRIEHIAAYQKNAPPPATRTGIRRDLDLLAAAGLIAQQPDPADARAVLVVPGARLVAFYNDAMPRLATEVRRRFPAASAPAQDGDRDGDGDDGPATPPA